MGGHAVKPGKRRESDAPTAPPDKFPGFTDGGKFFWSETPVTNSITNWVRRMIDEIPRELLSPAHVVRSLVHEPKWIQDCFSPYTLANWVKWERFSDWPFADAPSSFTRCLKDFGRGYPLWFRDDKKWSRMCDAAEQKYGQTSRFDGIVDPETDKLIATLAEKFS
jgi:hypothetical protein